jgi:hypothetical protein
MSETEQPPVYVYSEQALDDYLAYLSQSLSEEQHGGIYRVSDFNGSGLTYHGGQDKADPYILIWVVDKAAVERVVKSYSGQQTEIVSVDAAYSMQQLNAIVSEIKNSEIASCINGAVFGEDNRILLDIIGTENEDKVNSFLQSYKNKSAVSLFVRSNVNPVS